MADLGSLVVKLSAETSEFRADLGRTARLLDRHANDMKTSLQQVATVAKTAFAVAIGPDGHPNSPTYGHLKLPHLN